MSLSWEERTIDVCFVVFWLTLSKRISHSALRNKSLYSKFNSRALTSKQKWNNISVYFCSLLTQNIDVSGKNLNKHYISIKNSLLLDHCFTFNTVRFSENGRRRLIKIANKRISIYLYILYIHIIIRIIRITFQEWSRWECK